MKKRLLQYLYFWLYTIFALFVPIALIVERYGFLDNETPSSYKIATGVVLSLVVSIFYFRKHIGGFIENLPSSIVKYILIGVRELAPLITIYIVFLFVNYQMESLVYIMKYSCISNAVALGFRTLHLKQIDLIKEENENQ